MKRTTQIVVDTISAQEAADHLALLSDNLIDAVELQPDISSSLLEDKEREKEEKDLADSETTPAVVLASAGETVDLGATVIAGATDSIDQQSYDNYGDETGGSSPGINPWLAVGGGILAVAGIVALADSDDDDSNKNNNGNPDPDPDPNPDPDPEPTNNAPVLSSINALSVVENNSVSFVANASDADNDNLVFSASTPNNGTVTQSISGSFTYTPNADFVGSDSFNISVSDGKGGTDIVAVNVTITAAPNEAPVFSDGIDGAREAATDENQDVVIQLNATDPDGDTITYSFTQAGSGTVSFLEGSTNQLVYTPNPNFVGTDTFTVTADDGNGGTATQTINMRVDIINTAPVAGDDTFSVDEDVTTELDVLANDSDSDNTLDGTSVTLLNGVSNGTLSYNGDGTFDYTPNAEFSGSDSFTYTLTDPNGASDTATVSITVEAVNDAPMNTVPDTQGTNKNTPLVDISGLSVDDIDLGDNDLTVTLEVDNGALNVSGPATVTNDGTSSVTLVGSLAAINSSLASVTYTPDVGFTGDDTLTMTTNDGGNTGSGGAKTDSDSVTITVTENDAVIGGVNTGSVTEDDANNIVTGALTVTDPDNGDEVFQAQTDTEGTYGSFTLTTDGNWSYTLDNVDPDTDALKEGQVEEDTFTVQSADGTTETVTISVTGTNDAPVATDDEAVVDEDNSVIIDVIENDVDPEGELPNSTFAVETDPTNGSVISNDDGTFTYTPNANFNGTDSFTYSVEDPSGGVDTATVAITVNPVVDPIALEPQAQFLTENAPLTVTVNVENPDATGPLSYTVVENPQFGSLASPSGNQYEYTPAAGFVGRDTIKVRVTNGESDPVFQVINIFVDDNIINGTVLTSSDEEFNGSNGDDRYYGVLGDSDSSDALNLTTFTTDDAIFASLGIDTLFLDISAHVGGLVDMDLAGELSNLEVLQFAQGANNVVIGANAMSAGIDTLIGNSGNDSLDASAYSDNITIQGLDGDDTLAGGTGNDTLTGGAGSDTFVISGGTDAVTDLAESDVLMVSAGAIVNATVSASFVATGNTSNNGTANLLVGDGLDVNLSAAGGSNGFFVSAQGNTSASTLRGSSANDQLIGGNGDDLLVGGDGDDDITAGDGLDIIGGLLGNDDITLNADAVLDEVHFRSGDGSDTVSGFEVTADGIFFLDGDGSNGSVAFSKDDSADGAAGTLFTAGDTDDYEEFAVAAEFTANANGLSNAVALLDDPTLTDDLLDALTSSATNTYLVVENATTSQVQILFDNDWSSAGDYEVVATFTDLADTSGLDVTNFGIY